MGTSQSNEIPSGNPPQMFAGSPSQVSSENSSEIQPLSAIQIFKKSLGQKKLESIYPSPDTETIKATSKRPTKPAPHSAQTVTLYAEPMGPKIEDIGRAQNQRTQIHETANWPYSVHGVVVCTIKGVRKWGTGIMIGPNVVLTAGHNLYDYKLKQFADVQSLRFLPGMNGQVLPFGPAQVEQYFVSPSFIKEGKEDYAILLLKEPIGEMTGYFGLACLEPEEIKAQILHVTGYPSDKVTSKPGIYELWGMEGTALHIEKEKGEIHYYTVVFQSGSGVWYQEGENYYVCGVHWSRDRATLLTRDIYRQIHQWLQQANSNEFLFKLREDKTLSFWSSEMSPEAVSLLMKYNLDDLISLTVMSDDGGEFTGVKELVQNPSWTNLSKLELISNYIGIEGAKALAQNTSWVSLSELNLMKNGIGADGAEALAQNSSWTNLSELNLSGNSIGADGAKALAKNTSWAHLSKLRLNWNSIGAEGAKSLAENISWVNLSELDLSSNDIGAEGAKALTRNTSWVSLSWLSLSDNSIGDEGAESLAENTSWINLSWLNLSGNKISTEGANGLAKNTSWKKLSTLFFSPDPIDLEGAKALRENETWKNIEIYGIPNEEN